MHAPAITNVTKDIEVPAVFPASGIAMTSQGNLAMVRYFNTKAALYSANLVLFYLFIYWEFIVIVTIMHIFKKGREYFPCPTWFRCC